MRVNVARVWDDADYMKVRNMCDNNQGWREVYKKKGISVFSQSVPSNNFQMIKACFSDFKCKTEKIINALNRFVNLAVAKFPDVLPSVAYDVLHDSSYRSHWDRHMASQCFIGIINPNNDMGYYACWFCCVDY
uniref:START domain-containing protein n=1 Tax=Angiostrongylus cantonensis TaxID=6313 RepID=A0A0K0DQR2_ANGCA